MPCRSSSTLGAPLPPVARAPVPPPQVGLQKVCTPPQVCNEAGGTGTAGRASGGERARAVGEA